MIELITVVLSIGAFTVYCQMKRSRAPSALAAGASQVTTTTTVVKKPKTKKQTFSIPRWAGKNKTGFPKELRMTHRYTDRIVLTATAGATTSYTYSCNGLYDPYTTGTGRQPYYFDQLSAIYRHYTVLKSTCTIRIAPVSSTAVPACFTLYLNDDSTVTHTNADTAAENPTALYKILGIGAGGGETVFRKTWNAKEHFGPGVISDPNLQGNDSSNPTEQQHFTFICNALDGTSTVVYHGIITIDYDAVWQELREVATS